MNVFPIFFRWLAIIIQIIINYKIVKLRVLLIIIKIVEIINSFEYSA